MTDAYQRTGPLGNSPVATSDAKPARAVRLDRLRQQGRLVSVCPSLLAPPQARIMDPDTLATISTYTLPTAPDPPGTPEYQNFTGGGYFFLDDQDRLWVPTKTDHIFVLSEGADGSTLTLDADYDLTSVLDPATERITSALPDFYGRIWFVSKKNGKIGTLDPKTGAITVKNMGEEIENSFAVGSDGIYIVSDKRMYRFKAGASGRPRVAWKVHYQNSGIVKPSQVDAGSGTTPTIMDNGYVAITDNADPMNVVVYRRTNQLHGQDRTVCEQPVFKKGASATENSLLTAGRSIIVENNYGYQDPFGPNSGAVTQPGFARVDIKQERQGLQARVDEQGRPGPDRGPEALDQDRPDLHLRPPGGPERPRATTGPRSTGATARPRGASTRARASASTTTTPASRSARTARPTSEWSAGSSRCARRAVGSVRVEGLQAAVVRQERQGLAGWVRRPRPR